MPYLLAFTFLLIHCKVWHSHSVEFEDSGLLAYDAVYPDVSKDLSVFEMLETTHLITQLLIPAYLNPIFWPLFVSQYRIQCS
jgi:hypothetical protein